MKHVRLVAYLVLAAVYAAAAALGIAGYLWLGVWLTDPLPFWLALLVADVAATVFVFLFSLIFRNASVYDPYWSVQPIVILVAFAAVTPPTAANVLPLVAVLVWGIRLTANWAYTFLGLSHQDWRYTMLAEKTGKGYFFVNFVGIHLVPTLVVYGCVLPAVFTYVCAPTFNAGSAVFFAVSILASVWQGIADVQMHAFRKRKAAGKASGFCRDGLWKHTRHPNYLGEIVMWWGIALAAVCVMPTKWWLIAGAVANTLLFLCVSIPLADGRQAKKPDYALYRASTRSLLPIPRRAKQSPPDRAE